MTFIEDSHHDGTLWIKKLNPKNDQDFIILLQYLSCNSERARFYGYDFTRQDLIQYKFRRKNGEINNEIYVGPRDDFLEVLHSKDFISEVYDNSIGKYKSIKWRFNSKENIFEEIESWLKDL